MLAGGEYGCGCVEYMKLGGGEAGLIGLRYPPGTDSYGVYGGCRADGIPGLPPA